MTTAGEIDEDNAEDEDVVSALRSLKVGESVTFGGGAQPLVTITGLAAGG